MRHLEEKNRIYMHPLHSFAARRPQKLSKFVPLISVIFSRFVNFEENNSNICIYPVEFELDLSEIWVRFELDLS